MKDGRKRTKRPKATAVRFSTDRLSSLGFSQGGFRPLQSDLSWGGAPQLRTLVEMVHGPGELEFAMEK